MEQAWQGPLGGVTIIDFTHVLAGPFATQMLADLGARVIKIESPKGGDLTRQFPPFKDGESHYFLGVNHDKESVVLDLSKPEGVDIAKQLINKADVVVENFRPGVMDKLGLGYEVLKSENPKLIYCAISGFGLTGPLKDKPSFDIVTQALTGVMSVNGEPPGGTKLGIPIGDLVGGMYAPAAIASALFERESTGQGRLIDVSLYDGILGLMTYFPQLAWFEQQNPKAMGSSHPNIVPYGVFPTSDGQIVIACLSDAFWHKLCTALELERLGSDERLANMAGRKEHREAVDKSVEQATRGYSTEVLVELLNQHDVPNAPVLGVLDALEQPHSQARDMVQQVAHSKLGKINSVGRPVKFTGQPQPEIKAPPVLGEHTKQALIELLDLSPEQIEKLNQAKAIQLPE